PTTPTTAHIPLSLHDALPISCDPLNSIPRITGSDRFDRRWEGAIAGFDDLLDVLCFKPNRMSDRNDDTLLVHYHRGRDALDAVGDRKSTRLNSSHVKISYAVF